MYPQFFGFHKLPFRLRPDPDFLYLGKEYLQARSTVISAIGGHTRVILFLGAPGVGKTLLLDDVLHEVSGQFAACRINQPHISATELLQAIVMQLGTTMVAGENPTVPLSEVATALEATGSRAAPPMLVIDDAQLLTGATLVMIADLLSRAPRFKLLLAGRNDQDQAGGGLAARMVVAQKPRVIQLPRLDSQSAKGYIEHRLNVAGAGGKELFTADAHAMIFQHTAGSPRLINVLCDAALHAACLHASGQINVGEILAATEDARWPEALAREKPRPGDDSVESAAAPEPEVPSTAVARLLVSHRKEHIATLPVADGRISIGRASDNELRLEASFVSRHHCQIVTVGEVSTIKDLGSVNGIVVNGKPVKQQVLHHADKIEVGEHVLTYLVT